MRKSQNCRNVIQHFQHQTIFFNSQYNALQNKRTTLLKEKPNLLQVETGEVGRRCLLINNDLTPCQREARKPTVAKLKQRKAKGDWIGEISVNRNCEACVLA